MISSRKKLKRKSKLTSVDENVTREYVREYYLKDFQYLSPEFLEAKKKKKKIMSDKERTTCRCLMKLWMEEVMKGLKQFFYGGSLHGVKYIFEPSFSRKERATWVIIIVISIAICAVNITQLFCKWTSSPFVNVIDSLTTPIWAVPFPTVVLCPHINLKLSYRNVTELNELESFFASLTCPHMSHENKKLKSKLKIEEIKMLEDFIRKGSPNCSDVVKSCYWRAFDDRWVTAECCEILFRPIFTNYGLCFAFNSLPLNGMKNETESWQRNFYQQVPEGTLEWDLDAGYPKVFPPDPKMQPFRVMASGEMNGLGIELYLNVSDHQFACDGNSIGFNLLINSPTDHVYSTTVLRLPMDRMTTIEVTPITYRTDPTLRALKPNRRKCYFQDERSLDLYQFYTDSNCKLDLLIREARRICDCVLFNWPRSHITEPICSTLSDFHCIDDVKAKVEEEQIFAYFADGEEFASDDEHTSCHPSCNDILYSSQVFYSDLVKEPGDEYPKWGKPNVGEVTRVDVHFYDDMFLGQHRHAQYDDYYFVGAIGGLLSLFLGFSIISVAELIYFLILRPLRVVLFRVYFGPSD